MENRTEEAVLTRAPLQKETIHFNANGIEPLTFRGTKTKTEREGRRSIEREVFSYLPAKKKKSASILYSAQTAILLLLIFG